MSRCLVGPQSSAVLRRKPASGGVASTSHVQSRRFGIAMHLTTAARGCGRSTARRTTTSASSRGPSSARPRRGCWSTRPSRATTSTCTPSTGRSSRATAACRRADEDVLKETFRLDPGETLAVGAKFTDHLGPLPHPLPHAQPRGPRDDDHVRDRRRRAAATASARRSAAVAGAVVRGERVRVPLDTLTPAEALRTRALLAAQAPAPGVAARAAGRAAAPGADVAPQLICRLEGA